MGKVLKNGKVVILLKGRYAGKKAVIVRTYDESGSASSSNQKKSFSKCLVAGVDRTPLPVSRRMGKKKIARRTVVKPFVKFVNQNHLMPTRYGLEEKKHQSGELQKTLSPSDVKNREDFLAKKAKILRRIRAYFEEKFNAGQNPWFFSKLRF